MKTTLFFVISMIFVSSIIHAKDFVVYKMKYKYDKYGMDVTSRSSKEKFQVEGYVVMGQDFLDNSYAIENADLPQRIVYIKKNIVKKAGITLDKGVKGVFIDPTSPDAEYAGDDLADQYLPWSGEWVIKAFILKDFYILTEYYSSEETVGNNIEVLETGDSLTGKGSKQNLFPRIFKGISGVNTGVVENKTDFDGNVYIDTRSTLRYDKKLTQAVYGKDSMDSAVAAVTEYLNEKKYASTWK